MRSSKIFSAVLFGIFACAEVGMAGQSFFIRPSGLDRALLQKLKSGELEEVTVEFRKGDQLPVAFKTEGDLVESTDSTPSFVAVKRAFFVRMTQANFLMSLDGVHYLPIDQLVKGSLTMGARASDQDHIANGISIIFRSILK